jgi:hypothetical protein
MCIAVAASTGVVERHVVLSRLDPHRAGWEPFQMAALIWFTTLVLRVVLFAITRATPARATAPAT